MTPPTAPPTVTFAVEPVPALDALKSTWRQLDLAGSHSFFLTWTWIGTWLKFQPASANLALLRASENGETIGLALLTQKQSSIRGVLPIRQAWLNSAGDPAFDSITIEHNGFALSSRPSDGLWPSLARWFAENNLPADEFVLAGIRANAPMAEGHDLIIVERREPGYRTPLARISKTEGIAPLLSRNGRQKLRQSMRDYERQGPLRVEVAQDLSTALNFFSDMKTLHVQSWTRRGHQHAFSNPFFETFHRALIAQSWPERSVDMLKISAGEAVLGYLYNFRHAGTVFSYQSGFDDAAPRARPGYICHALAIAHYAESGMEYYDFLAETNRLKRSFGIEKYELSWRRLRKPTLGFRLEALARRAAGKIRYTKPAFTRLPSGLDLPKQDATVLRKTPRKVLVIGDDTRSFLATVRSLGRNGIEVHAAPFNFRAPALKSRYIKATHWLPYYLGDGREWLDAITALIDREQFALIIPCDERAIIPLNQHRTQLEARVTIAIPDARGLEVFFDKVRMREIAQALAIPVAAGRAISPDDTADILIAEVGLPLAIKPNASYAVERLYARNKVVVAEDRSALEVALVAARGNPHFFEAFFSGTGVGVSVLAHQGRILQAFQHRRVHELDGASHYRVSETPFPPMLQAVEKLMQAAAYTGIAMVEFRQNAQTGDWILLEVNARPWGSMPLPVALGLDFPYWWYRLLVEKFEIAPRTYRAGMYGRNLLPDLRYLLSSAETLRRHPLKLGQFLLASAAEYGRIPLGREFHDTRTGDDGAPGWAEIRGWFRHSLYPSLPWARSVTRTRRRDRALLRQALMHDGQGKRTIAFVCQGNICRSPFAADLLQRELSQNKLPIHVGSFGNLPRIGAVSPPNAIAVASTFGVDLHNHRSSPFSRTAADDASVIIVFDETNRRWIKERFASLQAPIVLLGSFSPHPTANPIITDPDGGDPAQFKTTYDAIADAITGLVRNIKDVCHDR